MAGRPVKAPEARKGWSFEPTPVMTVFGGILLAVGELKVIRQSFAIHGLSTEQDMALGALYTLAFVLFPFFLVMGLPPRESRLSIVEYSDLKAMFRQSAMIHPAIRFFGRAIARMVLFFAAYFPAHWALSFLP